MLHNFSLSGSYIIVILSLNTPLSPASAISVNPNSHNLRNTSLMPNRSSSLRRRNPRASLSRQPSCSSCGWMRRATRPTRSHCCTHWMASRCRRWLTASLREKVYLAFVALYVRICTPFDSTTAHNKVLCCQSYYIVWAHSFIFSGGGSRCEEVNWAADAVLLQDKVSQSSKASALPLSVQLPQSWSIF